MASLASLPFSVDTAMESSILLHSGNYRRPMLPVSVCRPRKSLDFCTSNDLTIGSFKVMGDDSSKWKIKRLKATGKGSGEVEDGEDPEDALQATIEKSKKLLAVQRDLLDQIAGRRKLVSSINSSMINAKGDGVSLEDGDGSFSTIDIASNDVSDTYEHYNQGFLSSSSVNTTVNELQEDLSLAINEDLFEDAKQHEKGLPLKSSSDLDSSKQLIVTASKVVVSDKVPAFLWASTATSSLKHESYENLKESRVEETGHEANAPKYEDVKPPPLAGVNVMNVILVAAECAPWIKTGGLGDVAGALPKALARRGHRVMVVTPLYGNYAEPQNTGIRKMYKVDGQDMEVTYFQAYIDGVDFVFIESPKFRHIGDNIYGGNRTDILKRMVLFCKAAVEVPWYVPCGGVCYGDGNLVFIANDWHTALLPVYLKAYYRDNGLMKYTRCILVIHNIAHQGRGPVDDFSFLDLPPHYLDLFRMYDPVGGEHFNIFAAGLKTADRVVTVSHGYAWELKTPEGGWGLHGIINENDWKLKGIVNGIDTKDWNPQVDIHLTSDGYTNYFLESLQTGKPQCKAALQKELGFPIRSDVPLIGFIGRLDQQKGVDLITEAVPWMVDQDVQLVMLGTGRPDLEQMLRKIENQHHDKIRGWVGFSVKTAHRITAGADVLLMPSRFEPCGLNQLYAMSYGTVPVVHAVGGLRDTVQPFNPYDESGVGWTFDRAEAGQLIHALGNCLLTYRQYKKSWEGIQRRGMMQDLSWDNAAENYEEVLVAAKHQCNSDAQDMTAESLTDTKEEDEAQPMMSEESKDPNTTPIVNENTKPRDSEAADVDDPNTEEAQSETSNSQEKTLKKPDKILPCPRCNSMETKFCYYNNYNVNQPRHFCKNCQRYWTAGGTMRNVPVGAGRRKNKYSASQYRHVAVSEALQNARVDLPNGIHHPAQKTNGNVLTFGSDTPLCESMTSVLKISGKTMLNGSQNGFHKPEEVRIPVSYGPGEIVDDYSSGSSVTAPNSKDEVGKPGLQNPVIQSCQSFPPQLPCYPGAPWPYPWNTGQWNSPVTQVSPPGFCHPGFPMPFYSSAPYWGCNVPVPGPWNVHWLSPTNLSPSQAAPSSVPNSPTLGKHSRDETMPKSTGSFDEDSVKENNPEKCLWVPKTLRIDDPGEAAKSSIWATLGIKNERADVVSGGGLFKAFQSKENEKGHISNPSSVLHANPAAMSRSQSFREST